LRERRLDTGSGTRRWFFVWRLVVWRLVVQQLVRIIFIVGFIELGWIVGRLERWMYDTRSVRGARRRDVLQRWLVSAGNEPWWEFFVGFV